MIIHHLANIDDRLSWRPIGPLTHLLIGRHPYPLSIVVPHAILIKIIINILDVNITFLIMTCDTLDHDTSYIQVRINVPTFEGFMNLKDHLKL